MLDKIQIFINYAMTYLQAAGLIGGFLLVVLESIIPALPLSVFVALNIISYGNFLGYIISWLGTICGCMISFIAFRYLFQKFFYKLFRPKTKIKIQQIMDKITHMDFNGLVLLIAMPFTPAFLVNIAAGLSNMSLRKFFFSILIGKIAMIYFWGYIGTNLIDSIKHPIIILKILIVMVLAYFLSKILEKVVKVDE